MKIDVSFVWTFALLASASVVQVPVILGQEELCSATNRDVCAGVSARMLSGAEVTDAARAQADQLIAVVA